MKKSLLPILMIVFMLAGCAKNAGVALSSSAAFDAKENRDLKGVIVPLGTVDKSILIEGSPTSPFLVTVGVSGTLGEAGGSSTAEILFVFKDGKLSPLMDWQTAGGGERPALRRENDNEITVYYPTDIGNQRTWVKFQVLKK